MSQDTPKTRAETTETTDIRTEAPESPFDPGSQEARIVGGYLRDQPGPYADPRARPLLRVCGRKAILARLDHMLAKEDNVRKIMEDMQAELDLAPSKFFFEKVVPLIPTDMLRDSESSNSPEDQAAKIREAVAAATGVTINITAATPPTVSSTAATPATMPAGSSNS